MAKVLIVDDDRDLAETLADILARGDHEKIIADCGKDALLRLDSSQPDLILLDLNLPDLDGADVLRSAREKSNVPIIVVSGRDGKIDLIMALELGADDYIAKPFNAMEVVARVKALLRRVALDQEDFNVSSGAAANSISVDGDWYVDFSARVIRTESSQPDIALTTRELSIFQRFAEAADDIVTKPDLLAAIGYPRDHDNSPLEVCLSRLKTKLSAAEIGYPFRSVRGVGYRYCAPLPVGDDPSAQ